MSEFIDVRLEPSLWLLGDWSLRWGVLIAGLAAWFALRPPRRAALRLAACQLVLVAGLALPLVPHWWGSKLLPARSVTTADEVATDRLAADSPDPKFRPPIAQRTILTAASSHRPVTSADHNVSEIPVMEPSSITPGPVPAGESLGALRISLLILATFWAVGVCFQSIRLIAAAIWLSRLRRSVHAPRLESQELFDRCREEIGLRRPVCLGIHPALTTPVFLGGWRASVLVPADWEQLPTEAQRAVLWHELAHAARRDDVAKLAEESIRAVFFFHPLVHWLLNRVDCYREQVCDAAAVQRGAPGRMLAQILVDFSRRNLVPPQRHAALHPGLPFFRRRTVRNRIRELLADQTLARWASPLLRSQFVGLALVAASAGIALGGLGLQAADSPPASVEVAGDPAL
jgi:beta-lactamase regulating signal transducer with metallopeptidase domain